MQLELVLCQQAMSSRVKKKTEHGSNKQRVAGLYIAAGQSLPGGLIHVKDEMVITFMKDRSCGSLLALHEIASCGKFLFCEFHSMVCRITIHVCKSLPLDNLQNFSDAQISQQAVVYLPWVELGIAYVLSAFACCHFVC